MELMMKVSLPFHHTADVLIFLLLAKQTLSVLCPIFIMLSTIRVSSLITLAPQHMRCNPFSSGVISDFQVELAVPHYPAYLRCRVTVNCCFCCHLVVLAFVLRRRRHIINASDLRNLLCGRACLLKNSWHVRTMKYYCSLSVPVIPIDTVTFTLSGHVGCLQCWRFFKIFF